MHSRNNAMLKMNSTDFQRRYEPNFAWQNALSMFSLLPGLRGFWPMSSFDASGNAFDFSGNGRTLTYNGNPAYGISGLAPYIDLDGIGDYLSRSDEAGLDITGSETYVSSALRGLTFGGWFYFNALGARPPEWYNEPLITKWATPNQYSYLLSGDLGGAHSKIFSVYVSNDGMSTFTSSSITIPVASRWFFVVGRYTFPNILGLFIDTEKREVDFPGLTGIFDGTADLQIGRDGYGSLFNGKASLCFLCATALPDGVIRGLYQHTRALFGKTLGSERIIAPIIPSPSTSWSLSPSISASISPSSSVSVSASPSAPPSVGAIMGLLLAITYAS